MDLTFAVKNQIIRRTDRNTPVRDSVNYLKAVFDFRTDEWDGKTKTAIFTADKSYEVLLDGNDTCVIPWEVLKGKVFHVSVFAGELITANAVPVGLIKSGYTDGETPEPPTPSVYEQIIKKLDAIIGGQIPPEEIEKAVNDYLEKHPIEAGISEEECLQIVSAFFTEHKAELKGDKGDDGRTPVKGVDYFDGNDGYTPIKNVDYFDGKPGKDGTDGKDYVITSDDYDNIADVVLDKLTSAESQVV